MDAAYLARTYFEKFDAPSPDAAPDAQWWNVLCPAHDDQSSSMGFRDGDKGIVFYCFAGCSTKQILDALDLTDADVNADSLTIEELARMKGFTPEYLLSLGCEEKAGTCRRILIPFRNADGTVAPRGMLRDQSPERFKWSGKKGSGQIIPYGRERLQEARDLGRLFLVEGVTDVWAGWLHGLPMLGIPGAKMYKKLEAEDLKEIPEVFIVQEPGDGGLAFIKGLRERLQTIGYTGLASIVRMPDGIKDICALHQTYPALPPDLSFNTEIDGAAYNAEALDLDEVIEADEAKVEERTKRMVLTGKQFEDLQLLWQELLVGNDPPTLFRYGGLLYKMRENGDLVVLDTDRLRLRLITLVDWYKIVKLNEVAATLDPMLLRLMLADDETPMPVLDRVVKAPVFSADGRLVQTPGYDAQSGIFLTGDLRVPPVSATPSDDEVKRAVALISELIVDFPFKTPADRTTAIALLLLAFARNMIRGATPLHLLEAAKHGTGKSLLLEVISTVVGGEGVGAMTEADTDEEMRKRLTAQLSEGPTFIVFENLNRMLKGGAIAQAITATTWKDRILGVSKMATLPVRCVWVAAANNPSFSGEVADRILACRMVATVERPRDRDPKTFKHPNLPQWVRANRGELVWACLTVIQNWIAKGRRPGEAVLGSFQSWAETMSGILEAVGIEGLLANRQELLERADPMSDSAKRLVTLWYQQHKESAVYTSTLVPLAARVDFARIDDDRLRRVDNEPAKAEQTKLGMALAKLVEQVFDLPDDGVRVTVEKVKQDMNGSRWRLRATAMAPMAPNGTFGLPQTSAGESVSIVSPETSPEASSEASSEAPDSLPTNPKVPLGATGAIGATAPAFCAHGRPRADCVTCSVPPKPRPAGAPRSQRAKS